MLKGDPLRSSRGSQGSGATNRGQDLHPFLEEKVLHHLLILGIFYCCSVVKNKCLFWVEWGRGQRSWLTQTVEQMGSYCITKKGFFKGSLLQIICILPLLLSAPRPIIPERRGIPRLAPLPHPLLLLESSWDKVPSPAIP